MIQAIKRICLVAVAIILCACTAPGPKFTELASPAKDQADVYLYRTSAFFASGQAFEVMLDGKTVGRLYNASYLHLRLSPGKYSLKVLPGGMGQSSELQLQLEPTSTSFLQYDFTTGLLANMFFLGSSIQARNQEQALLDLKELNAAK